MLGLPGVIQLLADARGDFLLDLAGVDHVRHAAMDGKQQIELFQIRLHGRFHIRVLQLAGEATAIKRGGAMHLSQRGGCRRFFFETAKAVCPVATQFGGHAALHEGPAHGGRFGLQLAKLFGVFRWHGLGNGRDQLRDLHQRALETAERGGQCRGIAPVAVGGAPHEEAAGNARGDTADIRADAGIARGTRGKAVLFSIGHRKPFSEGLRHRYGPEMGTDDAFCITSPANCRESSA